MDLKLKGKRALVLGASSGLGYAIAKALIQESATVAICSRSAGRIQQAARSLNAALALPCDVSKSGAVKTLVQAVTEQMGGIDIFVTNTGGPPKGLFPDITAEQWQEGFQNLWMSAVDGIQAVLPGMKAQKWGRILLVTSAAAKEPMQNLTISNGLRAGLLGLAKSLCHEVAPWGITVNALLPGYTRTERLLELGIPEEKIKTQIPAGRLGEPHEFASLAAYLASEQASYITGQAIACDGGYLKGV